MKTMKDFQDDLATMNGTIHAALRQMLMKWPNMHVKGIELKTAFHPQSDRQKINSVSVDIRLK